MDYLDVTYDPDLGAVAAVREGGPDGPIVATASAGHSEAGVYTVLDEVEVFRRTGQLIPLPEDFAE